MEVVPIAGQAPWQHGRTERQDGWRKELAQRTTAHPQAVVEDDMRVACAVVSGAKNTLSRRCGLSPEQWVWGKFAKRPAALVDGPHEQAAHEAAEGDAACGDAERQLPVQGAARTRASEALAAASGRLALLLPPGQGALKAGTWRGVVVGWQGSILWVAHNGWTKLVAPEHVRLADHAALWSHAGDDQAVARDEAEQGVAGLDEGEPVDEYFRHESQGEVPITEGELVPVPRPSDDAALPMELADMLEELERGDEHSALAIEEEEPPHATTPLVRGNSAPNSTRWSQEEFKPRRRLNNDAHAPLNDLPIHVYETQDALRDTHAAASPAEATYMFQRALVQSVRMRRKTQANDIAWRDIPDSDRPLHAKAAAEQWDEWKKFGLAEVRGIKESNTSRAKYHNDRFLPSSFVYRNKNAGLTSEQLDLPVKAKARLCYSDIAIQISPPGTCQPTRQPSRGPARTCSCSSHSLRA